MEFLKPTLTVVTPTFNQAKYIAQTLQSVLDQKLGPQLQYIVQDSCSTDGTEEIIRSFEGDFRRQGVQWLYVREKDTGQADAINRGWRLATGDVLGFLIRNDLYRPGALSSVLQFFDQSPAIKWAYGGWRLIGETGRCYRSIQPPNYKRSRLLNHSMIGQPACFFKREMLDLVGFLNAELHLAMDYDLWLRMSDHYPAGIIPTILADMRYYPAAKSAASVREQLREILLLGKKYSQPLGWRRLCQYFYFLRGWAVVTLGKDVSSRIARMEPDPAKTEGPDGFTTRR